MTQELFGGSSSSSSNKAYPYISSQFGGSGQDFSGATNQLGNILGVNGSSAQSQGLNNYWNSAGGQFQLNQGLDSLTSKFAGMGMYKSGAAAKAMEGYRSGLASTYLNNYLSQLGELGKLGLAGGGLISGAGEQSSGSSSTGNMGKDLFSLLALASDRRLKTNIRRLGEWDQSGDGLGKYEWNWKSNPAGQKVIGVIADEVEKLRPWAFVPNFVGQYSGVNYGAL